MKKVLAVVIIFVVLAIPIKSYSITFDSASMPKPFHEVQGGGGSYFMRFAMLCSNDVYQRVRLDAIPLHIILPFVDIDDFNAWTKCDIMNRIYYEPVTSLMEYRNLFSFIVNFNIPVDELKGVMEESEKRGLEAGLSVNFTQNEIDLIATLDEARILEHFASNYVILHDGRGFPPAWIYWHDTEAYEAVGITAEMIEEKMHLYAEFSFTEEATLAFEAKLSEFLGREVVLINERALNTSDALMILRAVAGLAELTDAQIARFGIDGEPSTADAMRILRVVAGL
jgi:hypothetical protein